MNDYSQPPPGKISEHGNGIGAPSPEEVERRAREIAMIDERNVFAEFFGLAHVVGSVDNGRSGVINLSQITNNGISALYIDADGGLVQKQNVRFMNNADRQIYPPLHAT